MTFLDRRAALKLVLASTFSRFASAANKLQMRACSIDFPSHVLEFSLPKEILQGGPFLLKSSFDSSLTSVNEAQALAAFLYDFNGPFWVGAVGSLKLEINAIQRSTEFEGDISTVDGLKNYIRWWVPLIRKGIFSSFGIVTINGTPAVSRRFDADETLSLPLNESMFIDFHLSIEYVHGGKGGWVQKAQSMIDAIRATIALRPKKPGSPISGVPSLPVG